MGFFPGGGGGVERPGRQFNHFILSSAQVNTAWNYNFPRFICLRALAKDRFALSFKEMLILGVIASSGTETPKYVRI
jgi:hypothetical protein